MMETRPKLFDHVKRIPVDYVIRRVDHMISSQIIRDK